MDDIAKDLILEYNPNLKPKDLDLLFKLVDTYDIFSNVTTIMTSDIETIISYIILDELPYRIGIGLVDEFGCLKKNLVKTIDNEIYISDTFCGSAYIQEQIDNIKNIIVDES